MKKPSIKGGTLRRVAHKFHPSWIFSGLGLMALGALLIPTMFMAGIGVFFIILGAGLVVAAPLRALRHWHAQAQPQEVEKRWD